jgi:hypothetical protein
MFPGGSLVAYDTLASTLADDFTAAAVCLETYDPDDAEAIYDTAPEPSQVIFFVVRARNGCGFGPAGTNSSGVPRFLRDCP